jgi:uncharacterized Zn finger protein
MSARLSFGQTWWGQAWVRALEGRARLDPNRLPRGRTYARHDRVSSLEVRVGEVTADVQGRRRTPYRVRLRVRQFTATEWSAVIDAIASRSGHAAALFDGELLPEIVDDAAAAGVELFPGAGELVPSCSCPDWADPCKHAAAVCYLVAQALDEDPFGLFHLRGRPRDRLLADVRESRHAVPAVDAEHDNDQGFSAAVSAAVSADGGAAVGAVAREVFARAAVDAAEIWALDVNSPPERAGLPPHLPVSPPDHLGLRAEDLRALAVDAAARAWALTIGIGDSGLGLSEEEDLARLGARALGSSALAGLAARSGVTPRRLTGWAIAWDAGEREGFFVTEQTWSPPPEWVDEGRRALAGDRGGSGSGGWGATVRENRVSGRGIQLRVGPSGLWYRFMKVGSQWQIDGPPAPDPVTLVETM